MRANIAVTPATPTASVSTAAAVKPLLRHKLRQARRTSCTNGSIVIGRTTIADQLNHDLTVTATRIELDQDDLLPRPDAEVAAFERNRERWAKHSRSHVTGSVVVTPLKMVLVLAVSWCELFPVPVQVSNRSRLELDGGDAGRRSNDSNGEEAVLE